MKWIRENQWKWQKIVGWFYCIYAKEEKRMKNLLHNCENGEKKKSTSNKNTQNQWQMETWVALVPIMLHNNPNPHINIILKHYENALKFVDWF